VGFGVGINLNSVKKKLGIFEEWCSPTYIYNGARYIEGMLPFDAGCYPKDALDWTLDYGILDEHFWPYDPNMIDMHAPSSEKISQANRYVGFRYWRAVDGVDGLCDALATGFVVSIGTPWFNEWINISSDGILPIPTVNSAVAGGHETALFAYDRKKSVFLGVNSWGTEWGNAGKYTMPFESIDMFKEKGGYDAHYISFTSEIDNNPPPEPDPSDCVFGNGIARFMNKFFLLEERGRKGRFSYK
jgi:hypothetical protein